MLSTARLLRFSAISCFVLLFRACAEGEGVQPISNNDGGLDASGDGGSAGKGGAAGPDGTAGSGGGGGESGGGGAAGGDASGSGGSTSDAPSSDSSDAPPTHEAGGMDPGLSLPGASGQTCYVFGSSGECPIGQVCRLFSPSEGRCEACTPPCGKIGASCTSSAACDILFQCFLGACTDFCRIGQKCGAVDDCVNVGHPTGGVCPP